MLNLVPTWNLGFLPRNLGNRIPGRKFRFFQCFAIFGSPLFYGVPSFTGVLCHQEVQNEKTFTSFNDQTTPFNSSVILTECVLTAEVY